MVGTSVVSSVVNTPSELFVQYCGLLAWVTVGHAITFRGKDSRAVRPFDEGVELLGVFCDHVSHVRLVSLPTFILLLFLKVFVPLEIICCP